MTSVWGDPGQALGPTEGDVLRLQRPELPPLAEIAPYYALAEAAGYFANGGPCHEMLATRLAAYVGGGVTVLPVANCTLGLTVALREACGPPTASRRLIAMPSFTFTATAGAAAWAGFEPLLVDVDEQSWQMDPTALAGALEAYDGAVAGVMGCSTFGTPPPSRYRERWREISSAHGVPLLLDSAAAFGAIDEQGQRSGSQGDVEVFSFHATKPFAIGEGGAIVVDDEGRAMRLRQLTNFGLDALTHASTEAGTNAKMSEIVAATALAMLDRFDVALASRRRVAAEVEEALAPYPVAYQQGVAGSTRQLFQMLVPDSGARARTLELAARLNIEVRTYHDPGLHRHPAYARSPRFGTMTVTDGLAARCVSLPLANTFGPERIARVVGLMDAVFRGGLC